MIREDEGRNADHPSFWLQNSAAFCYNFKRVGNVFQDSIENNKIYRIIRKRCFNDICNDIYIRERKEIYCNYIPAQPPIA